jgi:hypothetical protein
MTSALSTLRGLFCQSTRRWAADFTPILQDLLIWHAPEPARCRRVVGDNTLTHRETFDELGSGQNFRGGVGLQSWSTASIA